MTNGQLLLGMGIYANIAISIGITAYFQYKKLEDLENHLDGNESVEWNKRVWGCGYMGRLMRLNMIFVTLLMARRLHRNGHLAKDEEKKIPEKLRKKLLVVYAYETIVVLSALAFHFTIVSK